MSVTTRAPNRVRFADIEFDLQTGELWQNGSRSVLPEQLFRLLAILIRGRPSLVTRDAIRHALWSDDTFVDFERGLNAAIKRLREVLGDSADAPRFIETIPRRGYRFIAPVVDDAVEPGGDASVPKVFDEQDPGVARRQLSSPPWAFISSRSVWPAAVAAALLVGGVLALGALPGWRSRSTSDRSQGARLVRLTSTAGLNIDPALSPDGSLLAYASDRAGAGDLDVWVQPVGGDSPVRITMGTSDEIEPSFSHDGAQIVFAQGETGGISVVGALGGEPRLLVRAAHAHTPRFSPDGRWVAYWTGLPVGISQAAGASGSAFLVPVAGGSPRAVLSTFASARHPIWSPDGRRLLVLGTRSEAEAEPDWYVVDVDGGDPIKTGAFEAFRKAGAVSGRERPIPAAWTSAGDAIVMATTARTSSSIWQLPISPVTGRVTGAPQQLTFGTAIERSPAAAASRIAFASLAENVDIWRLPLDQTTGMAAGALERVTKNPAVDQVMNLTRDGRTMAFVSSRAGQNDVWIRDVASGEERRLTWSGVAVGRISPDGSQAVLWGFGPRSMRGVEVVDLSDGAYRTVCRDCERAFGWAPYGSQVLVTRTSPSRLFVHDFASGRQTLLAGHPTWLLREGRFSPDGRWVAFYSANGPDQRQIHVIPAFAASPIAPDKWLTVVEDAGSQPSWSRDGTVLYHISERDGAICLWGQRLDSLSKRPVGPPEAVLHLHDPRLRAGTGAIASNDVQDGYLYLTLTETTGNVWMLDGVNVHE